MGRGELVCGEIIWAQGGGRAHVREAAMHMLSAGRREEGGREGGECRGQERIRGFNEGGGAIRMARLRRRSRHRSEQAVPRQPDVHSGGYTSCAMHV